MGTAYVVCEVTHATLRALNYAPEIDLFRRSPKRFQRGWSHRPLGALTTEFGKTYAKVLQRIDCDASVGEELLSQADVFAAEPSGRHIRGDTMRFVEDLRIQHADILIAGAGQMGDTNLFGRSMIADRRLVGKLAAADLMVLRSPDPRSDAWLYTYAFLLSAAGLRGTRSAAYGTSIPRMRPDLLADLPVPFPDEETQARVAEYVRASMAERERYSAHLLAARSVVADLPATREALEMAKERKARAVAWTGPLSTLMGWTYASHGGALAYLQRAWSRRLGDSVGEGGMFYGLLRQRTSCSKGYGVPLITQRDALAIRQLPEWIVRPAVPSETLLGLHLV